MAKKEKSEDKKLVEFIGETICTESAILAASINLMRAGDVAKDSADADSLIKVAKAWYDLAKLLSGSDEEEEGSDDRKHHFGFAALETVDDHRNEPHEGESGPEVCS